MLHPKDYTGWIDTKKREREKKSVHVLSIRYAIQMQKHTQAENKGMGKGNESHSVVSNSLRPHGLYSPWNSVGQNTGVGSLSFLWGNLPNPGIKPRSSTLQPDSLPAKPQGKLKNTGVGSLSHLQWIFPTQESNQGLLHCRWIFYQLSYHGSPSKNTWVWKILTCALKPE